MTFKETRPYADPDAAARKIVELANSLEPYMDNRLLVEKINGQDLPKIHPGWRRSVRIAVDGLCRMMGYREVSHFARLKTT